MKHPQPLARCSQFVSVEAEINNTYTLLTAQTIAPEPIQLADCQAICLDRGAQSLRICATTYSSADQPIPPTHHEHIYTLASNMLLTYENGMLRAAEGGHCVAN